MTSHVEPSSDLYPNRRGSTSEQGDRHIRYLGGSIEQWCTDRGLPPGSWTDGLVVELYMLERAAAAWHPPGSNLGEQGLKAKSLASVPGAVISHGLTQKLDMSCVSDHECITNLVGNFTRRLPIEQVASVRAQPLTDARADQLLSHLDRLEQVGAVHPVWAQRWRTLIRIARASGLRRSEIVRVRFSWIGPAGREPSEPIMLTIPYAKSNDNPETIRISPETPGGKEAIEEWDRWIELLQQHDYSTDGRSRAFPRVEVDKEKRGPRYRPVAEKTLAEFPHLADEYTGDLEPRTIAAGSNKDVGWRCRTCSHEWRTKILRRTSMRARCPACSKELRAPLGTAPREDEPFRLIDRIKSHIDDAEFRPDDRGERRTESAIIAAGDELAAEFRKIAVASGLEPRTSFETISSYATRRGMTVELANADANRETMRQQLRHEHPKTSAPYIEERDITLPPALTELDGWTLP